MEQLVGKCNKIIFIANGFPRGFRLLTLSRQATLK